MKISVTRDFDIYFASPASQSSQWPLRLDYPAVRIVAVLTVWRMIHFSCGKHKPVAKSPGWHDNNRFGSSLQCSLFGQNTHDRMWISYWRPSDSAPNNEMPIASLTINGHMRFHALVYVTPKQNLSPDFFLSQDRNSFLSQDRNSFSFFYLRTDIFFYLWLFIYFY